MILSKKQGEKLAAKELIAVYGGLGCGGLCGNCDWEKVTGKKQLKKYKASGT